MRKFILYVFPATLVLVVLVNLLFSNPSYQTLEEELDEYIILGDVQNQNITYWKLIQKDSTIISNHFNFLKTYFELPLAQNGRGRGVFMEYNQVVDYYRRLLSSPDYRVRDIGKFGRGMFFYHTGYIEEALTSFTNIYNQELPYLNYIYGSYFRFGQYEKSIEYLQREIFINPQSKDSYKELANTYLLMEEPFKLDSLLLDSVSFEHASNSAKRYAYFKTKNIKAYSNAIFSRFFKGFNAYGLLGALLILIVWFVYLLFIHKFLKKRWGTAMLILFLGMIFAFGTSLLTDFNSYILGYRLKDEFFNDFIYCILGIGAIEELMKIIPLFLVMLFSKQLKEPIDYVVFASISALGFAFIENLIYFDEAGLKTIQGRSLSSTVTHMFNSSLIAYGIAIGKFAKKRNWGWYCLFFYALASIFHGFYDFWLINSLARIFSFITFIWLLVSMVVWVSVINNCLNNSYNRSIIWTYNPEKLNSYLLFGLSAIFLLEYVLVAWRFNADIANAELKKDLSSGFFLLIFLTAKLSKFDVIPNYWAPLKFWDWNTLFSIPRVEPQKFNLQEIIGLKIELRNYGDYGVLSGHLPIRGEVVKRELLSWEKDWYLIKLDEPLKVAWKKQHFILLKTKDENEIFLKRNAQPVQVRLVNKIDDLAKARKRKRDFLFVDLGLVSKLE
ncbi:MAG: PrsW family glutamic-type intramembrane protease [Flavobacteriales bacterium]